MSSKGRPAGDMMTMMSKCHFYFLKSANFFFRLITFINKITIKLSLYFFIYFLRQMNVLPYLSNPTKKETASLQLVTLSLLKRLKHSRISLKVICLFIYLFPPDLIKKMCCLKHFVILFRL